MNACTKRAWLFPAVLLAAFLQNFYDLSALFSGEPLNLTAYEGPLFYKLGKDLIYFLLVLSVLVHAYWSRRNLVTWYTLSILIIIVALSVLSASANSPVVALLGLRWAFPFILFLIMKDWTATIQKERASRWLLLGLLFCFGAQIYEIFNMPPVFGEVFDGIPARTPGIFIAPNSAAFFACAAAGSVLIFTPTDLTRCWLAVGLAAGISTLAQSGTGMVAACLLALRLVTDRRPILFWTAALAVVPIMFLSLDSLTRREEYLLRSGGGRVEVLFNILAHSALSLTNFGVFTNAATLQHLDQLGLVIPDSLVASWIGNFGLAALPVLLLSARFLVSSMRTRDWKAAAPCWLTFALFSMTTIVFEAFPMNVLLAVSFWSSYRCPVRDENLRSRRGHRLEMLYSCP